MRQEKSALEAELNNLKNLFKEIEGSYLALKQLEQEFPAKLEKLRLQLEKADALASELKDKVKEDERMRQEINRVLDKTGKNTEDLIGTLSCLSCLNYLKDPMVLKCGHSICNSCFT